MDNNEISGALSKLLEDPAALSKAMSIASSLMGNLPATPEAKAVSNEASDGADSDTVPPITQPETPSDSSGDAPSVAAIAKMLGGGTKGDPRCALLYALKPYMGHGRAERIDTLVNMLRLADLAGGMLGGKLF